MLGAVPGLGPKRAEALLATQTIAELAALTAEELTVMSVGGKRLGETVAKFLASAFNWRSSQQ